MATGRVYNNYAKYKTLLKCLLLHIWQLMIYEDPNGSGELQLCSGQVEGQIDITSQSNGSCGSFKYLFCSKLVFSVHFLLQLLFCFDFLFSRFLFQHNPG